MIQEFHINTWLENKDAKVITRDNRLVKILGYDEANKLITAEVDGTIRYYHPNGRYIEENKSELSLWIEIYEELTDFENAIFKLLLPPYPITRKEALQRACKVSTELLEIAKNELKKGN